MNNWPSLMRKKYSLHLLIIVSLVVALTGCTSKPIDQVMLMPTPDVLAQGAWDPFTDRDPIKDIPYGGILYATDRKPAEKEGQHYLNERGHELRLGVAQISIGKENMLWEEARKISLLKPRPKDYPLKVTNIQEIGILKRSINAFTEDIAEKQHSADEDFAAKVNSKLAISKHKDVYIYVHGYKVVFENPLLVASELWHFLGYEGVIIAYAWPSTPKTLAYFSDLETAALSAGNLRLLIQYLSDKTDARRIHIIGFSAGTRLVSNALHQLALMNDSSVGRKDAGSLRLGHVILAGSDVDRHLFGSYLVDGMLDIVDEITIYVSDKDSALGTSKWVFGRQRVGQITSADLPPAATAFLQKNTRLTVINATDAPGADTGNGHAYFCNSPWTSSDILTTLTYDLTPKERGLIQQNDMPVWTFPENYIDQLRATLMETEAKGE